MGIPSMKAPRKGKKSFSRPPNKKANEEYGLPPRKKASDATLDYDASQGNVERGFIQRTPKKATGAMMGRPPPKIGKKSSTRSDGKRQFKAKAGRKVF